MSAPLSTNDRPAFKIPGFSWNMQGDFPSIFSEDFPELQYIYFSSLYVEPAVSFLNSSYFFFVLCFAYYFKVERYRLFVFINSRSKQLD